MVVMVLVVLVVVLVKVLMGVPVVMMVVVVLVVLIVVGVGGRRRAIGGGGLTLAVRRRCHAVEQRGLVAAQGHGEVRHQHGEQADVERGRGTLGELTLSPPVDGARVGGGGGDRWLLLLLLLLVAAAAALGVHVELDRLGRGEDAANTQALPDGADERRVGRAPPVLARADRAAEHGLLAEEVADAHDRGAREHVRPHGPPLGDGIVRGERAAGRGWLAASPLPDAARSENELACVLAGKPVHRAAWRCGGARDDADGARGAYEDKPKKRRRKE